MHDSEGVVNLSSVIAEYNRVSGIALLKGDAVELCSGLPDQTGTVCMDVISFKDSERELVSKSDLRVLPQRRAYPTLFRMFVMIFPTLTLTMIPPTPAMNRMTTQISQTTNQVMKTIYPMIKGKIRRRLSLLRLLSLWSRQH